MMELPRYPYLAELDMAIMSCEHVEIDNCLYCGRTRLSDGSTHDEPISSCLYKLDDCWYRSWCCESCTWFIRDLGAEKRQSAAKAFALEAYRVHDEAELLLSRMTQKACNAMFTKLHKLKCAYREMLVIVELYPTIQEYVSKVHRSAHVYLLLCELGFLRDIAWPAVALAYWILPPNVAGLVCS
jgi:hypothetical protein